MIVFFNQGSQCDFEKLDDYLGKLLKTSETKLFHEIQVGSVIEANTGAITTVIDLPDNPLNGASIALKSDTENAGILGGWLTLNNPADFSRIKVGVSCYHLISSPGPENIQKMDMKGLTPSEAQDKSLSIVYPAAMDMEAILKQINTKISNPNSLGTKEENLKNARRILAKPPIGRVIAASGIRINGNERRMDWVLIGMNGNGSRNHPPPRPSLIPKRKKKSWPKGYKKTTDSVVSQFGDMREGSWVVKQGRTTKTTTGTVGLMDRIVQWTKDAQNIIGESREVEVLG